MKIIKFTQERTSIYSGHSDEISAMSHIGSEIDGVMVLATRNEKLLGLAKELRTSFEQVSHSTLLIPTLLRLYGQRKRIANIVFDFDDPYFCFFDFMHAIRLNLKYALFRSIPVYVFNFDLELGKRASITPAIKVLGINGSPRQGNSFDVMKEHITKYWSDDRYYDTMGIVNLPHMEECTGCNGHQKGCVDGCHIKDEFPGILTKVDMCDVMIIATPVYMDAPTSRLLAFLSRLTSRTKFNRFAFAGKKAYVIVTGYCSGTKAVASQLINSLSLIGFDVDGRAALEKIEIWNDEKVRGGFPDEFNWPD